jgi:PEP-CTERM motif
MKSRKIHANHRIVHLQKKLIFANLVTIQQQAIYNDLMKMNFKTLALCGGMLAFGAAAQAQTAITGWGLDSANAGGWTLTDNGSGNFTVGGTAVPTGNTIWFATFTPVTLSVGQTLEYTGSLTFSSGNLAGGLFRIGAVNYTTPGTLSGGVWTGANDSASGYMLGIPTGGAGIGGANPSEVTGHNGGGSWVSSNNGYSVPGGANNNAANATASTYVFNLQYTLTTATEMTINYSFSDTGAGGSYSETGTATDNGGNGGSVATGTFNALGFFVNGSDSATSYTFNGVSEQVTVVPEPTSMALLGLGALVGAFGLRRKK